MSPAAAAAAAAAPSKAKANPSKSKKTAATATSGVAKKPRAYPTYHEMAKEAIVALKERSGSSQIAIAKFRSRTPSSSLLNLPLGMLLPRRKWPQRSPRPRLSLSRKRPRRLRLQSLRRRKLLSRLKKRLRRKRQ
ncbi:HISTONE H1 [Salix koriyanagi]|uniref:HISTONE H1 n=1 Tax=Salix koriyanagi TaxID=2511006 RepID=A0A9Q0WKQ0_9ROSI|nr:HISTONE H1 [Salix koriyanagi]